MFVTSGKCYDQLPYMPEKGMFDICIVM